MEEWQSDDKQNMSDSRFCREWFKPKLHYRVIECNDGEGGDQVNVLRTNCCSLLGGERQAAVAVNVTLSNMPLYLLLEVVSAFCMFD